VFTHITHDWSAWLLEMHRLLKPDGLLLVTLLGRQMIGPVLDEPWDEDRVGHLIANCGQAWDEGGPVAFVSPWWLRAHWGRAFDVIWIRSGGQPREKDQTDVRKGTHDMALLRPKAVRPLSREDLEAPEPGEERELRAAQYNVRILSGELARLRRHTAALREALEQLNSTVPADGSQATQRAGEVANAELRAALQTVYESRSWRITQPLRSVADRLRHWP
jgi:hypothetical protein